MGKREKDGLFCDEKERKSIILSKSAQREKKKDVHLRRRRSQERRGLKHPLAVWGITEAESPLARAAWIETRVLDKDSYRVPSRRSQERRGLKLFRHGQKKPCWTVAARKSGVD